MNFLSPRSSSNFDTCASKEFLSVGKMGQKNLVYISIQWRSFQSRVEDHASLCLKIVQKVSFYNIASEASSALKLTQQKGGKNTSFTNVVGTPTHVVKIVKWDFFEWFSNTVLDYKLEWFTKTPKKKKFVYIFRIFNVYLLTRRSSSSETLCLSQQHDVKPQDRSLKMQKLEADTQNSLKT